MVRVPGPPSLVGTGVFIIIIVSSVVMVVY